MAWSKTFFLCGLLCLAIFSAATFAQQQKSAQNTKQAASAGQKASQGELVIKTLKESLACDKRAQLGDTVSVHYSGKLQSNGQVFDSSRERGEPISFELGAGRVIRGWEQGILNMCPGELRRLTIPPHLAYGDRGIPNVIPPHSTLVFEVELVDIQRPGLLDAIVVNWDTLSTLAPVFIFVAVAIFFVWRASQVEVQSAAQKKSTKKK